MVAANNKDLVRRLYERGWNSGELRAIDEPVAPEFFDRHHRQGGRENLKGGIASLRTTFLDMRFTRGSTRRRRHGDDPLDYPLAPTRAVSSVSRRAADAPSSAASSSTASRTEGSSSTGDNPTWWGCWCSWV